MEKAEILTGVQEVMADILDVPKESVTEEKNIFDDLGADSLDIVQVVMKLEDEFKITIPDEKAEQVRTVQDMVNEIEKILNA